jgi:hypothetical protein
MRKVSNIIVCSWYVFTLLSFSSWILPSFSMMLLSRKDAIVTTFVATTSGSSLVMADSTTATVTATASSATISDEEKQRIQQKILERRKLMDVSRSANTRQAYLDLSRQRSALYNTTSQAWNCPPSGVPCL